MRISFLVRSLGIGGAERQLAQLAAGLAQRGHQVSVLIFYDENNYADDLAAAGVGCFCLHKRHRWDVVGFLAGLRRALANLRPDVLYSFLPVANVMAAGLSPLLPGLTLVWGLRASNMVPANYDRLSRVCYLLERRLARMPALIIANSDAGRAHAVSSGFPAGKLVVVHNGIDTDLFRPADTDIRSGARRAFGLPGDAPAIGVIARADVMKDHETFFRALALMAPGCPDVRAVLAGPAGSGAERLRDLACRHGVGDRLRWIEPGNPMPGVYAALDLVCLPSAYGEGFPNVIGEALSSGLPCVATDVGDTATVLGGLGRVVPPRAPEALAAAILDALRAPPDAEAARRRRQRIVECFSVSAATAETERLLRLATDARKMA